MASVTTRYIDEYINQHLSERLFLDVTEEDIIWQFRGSRSDYVNTRIQFDREKLRAVMDVMLSSLDSDELTLVRCRQVLKLWIAGLDMLLKEANNRTGFLGFTLTVVVSVTCC